MPKNANPKLAALIERCWKQDPTERPDFSEILEILQQLSKEVLFFGLLFMFFVFYLVWLWYKFIYAQVWDDWA